MDSQEVTDNNGNNKGYHFMFLRIGFALLFPIFAFFFLSFLVGFLAVFMGELSISNPISLPSQCKIVSSSVDIRSSKVCELGLLNYKAKHVFYPFERSKFRCRYDYYWTSVFKVNETYDCWYTSGISSVKLYNDGFFSCQAKDPSTIEMIKRYLIISTKILHSWISSKGRHRYWRWETVAGVVTGFSTSIITISFVRILQHMKSWLPQAINTVHIKRFCFLLVYFSVMGWLAFQYCTWLNIPIIKVYNNY
ncbi:hypothetical protein PTKIN_Ptkin04bG0239800 [Pterospermum kingtungense]